MQDVSVTQARNNLAEIINRVVYQAEEFLIRRRGEPVAVLVAPDEVIADKKANKVGVNPSETAGTLSLKDTDITIDEIYEGIKAPYDRKSILGH